MDTREAPGQAHMLDFLPERSRMDTREAQRQTYACPVPLIRVLADGHARGSGTNFDGTALPPRSLADRHARGAQGPGNTAFAAHPDAEMGAPFTTRFATGPRSPKRPLPPAISLHDASNQPARERRCPTPKSRCTRIGPASSPRGPSRLPFLPPEELRESALAKKSQRAHENIGHKRGQQ